MADQRVDLNTADRDGLTRIGIGDECAERSIRYREEHGRIGDVEAFADDLKGFGDQ